MMTTSFEEIFSDGAIEEALKELESKRDSCGVDGVYLSGLREFWEINHNEIRTMLMEEKYEPGIIREVEIVNSKGKKRNICLYNSIDRLILRCMAVSIQEQCDDLFEDNCFAFRNGFGVAKAVEAAAGYMNAGCTWLVKVDISSYFDAISVQKLEEQLEKYIPDGRLLRLIAKFLCPEIEMETGGFYRKRIGIVQGCPLSPFLSNLYLTPLDREMAARQMKYCRFADDIAVFFESKEQAQAFYQRFLNKLQNDFGLNHNKTKSGIFEGLNQQYLGYRFVRNKKSKNITALKGQKKKYDGSYSGWNRDAIQKIDRDYHIINDGILTRRDYNVLFDNQERKKYIPIETARAINIHSNISFSSDFFRFISGRRVDVNLFDRYGNYVGSFVPANNGYRGKTLLKQVGIYLDDSKRTTVARAMEIGALHNIRSNLRYYHKRKKTEKLQAAVMKMSEYITEINSAKTINDMMLIEARARELYYRMFNEILSNEKFSFKSRTKRPPKDPLNAMISFGNVYLYNRIATEINKTTLDIRIGFVHSTTTRSQSLNLDIADIFKPIIVDRVIFSLINLKMIDADEHFEEIENGAIYLNAAGKRLFINTLEEKIYDKQTENNHPISYESRIREEVSKVFRYVIYGEKYKPYKYQ